MENSGAPFQTAKERRRIDFPLIPVEVSGAEQ
jgi:hypothetical protein